MSFDDYEVIPYDWPDTFFVQDYDEIDRDQKEFYPDDLTAYPYLVDLSNLRQGECLCRDFQFNVLPYLDDLTHRCQCLHLIIATRFKNLNPTKPTQLPKLII